MGSLSFFGPDNNNTAIHDGSSPITAYPFTLGLVFKPGNISEDDVPLSLAEAAAGDVYLNIRAAGAQTGDPVQSDFRHTSIQKASTTTGMAPSPFAWHSAVVTGAADDDHAAFIDGGSKGTNGVRSGDPLNLANLDRIHLGAIGDASPTNYYTGFIGYVFIWDVVLTDQEVADFHAGTLVQEANLVAWYDLTVAPVAGVIPDQVGARDLTVSNATFNSEESPPVTYGGGGATTIQAVGNIASAEAFGEPKAVRVAKAEGISSAEAFGTPFLTSPQYVRAVGQIASAEAFGEPDVLRVLQAAGAINSAEAFGEPRVLRVLRPVGIASLEAFGEPRVLFVVRPTGIESEEAVGEPVFPDFATDVITIRAVGNIASAEAFGTPGLIRLLRPEGIASAETFGNTKAVRLVRNAGGIVSLEAVGEPKALRVLRPEGVQTAESFGEPKLLRLIFPVGIETAEAFGVAHLFDPDSIGPSFPGGVLLSDQPLFAVLVGDRVYFAVLLGDARLGGVRLSDFPGG